MTDAELLLTPTVVFGFSLVDKVWLEFNVEKIDDVDWNTDAFANLVLPGDRKHLLQSLVEAHHKEVGFDDFIKGKGHGLVVNLFGPPGVGKTFSAEATSEHVQRPLYVVGGGDLGTSAAALDSALERIFDVATAWKAIVLIDEADVFLEQRSLHDLERNAMVAVFLRHVEYYRGILFLTTNRVKAFDEAFLSRIHVALHFSELSEESKEQVWAAFIAKMGDCAKGVTKEQIKELARRDINGRQIKNAARTAHSLAVAKGEDVCFEHLRITLDALDEFTKEFERKNAGMYM
jgi:SpoVK/Ycf46/Vps4 family AAA+-type ATPase